MPSIGPSCHELKINDAGKQWRIIYRIDDDAVVIGEVFLKTTQKTPISVIRKVQQGLRNYDRAVNQ